VKLPPPARRGIGVTPHGLPNHLAGAAPQTAVSGPPNGLPRTAGRGYGGPVCAVRAERELVERDSEMTLLRDAVAAACAGRGGVVVVEAPAGQGKTALLRALRSDAAGAGMRVLTAVGAEFERDFPFGIVQQLFAAELRRDDPERHARLFAGAAELARAAFEIRAVSHDAADVSYGRLHGLYWLAANLSDEQPLALAVDDAHWADAPSLRFLDVLARRVEELPILLVVSARPAEPGAEQDLLDSLVAGPTTHVVRPQALTTAGVAELLERTIGEPADDTFVAAAAETTAGSPLLVAELLRTVAAEGLIGQADEIAALRRALPTNVGRIVLGRLRRLAPDALAVARSVAVLGDRARIADIAELAAVPVDTAVSRMASLRASGCSTRSASASRIRSSAKRSTPT
jgi:predicted ATPase